MKKILVSLACLGLLIANSPAEANLITNGSFEDDSRTIDSFITLDTGSNLIPGWSVVGGSIDWIGGYWEASDGNKSIDLAGYYAHGLIMGTEFTTEIGKTYRVQFDMAGNPDKDYEKSLVTVAINDASGLSHSFTFDQAGNTKASMGWETKFFDFVASDTTSLLYFGDITGDESFNQAWGAALDNVRVDLAPVPEPSTIFLVGAGLAGLGIFGRRFRR